MLRSFLFYDFKSHLRSLPHGEPGFFERLSDCAFRLLQQELLIGFGKRDAPSVE